VRAPSRRILLAALLALLALAAVSLWIARLRLAEALVTRAVAAVGLTGARVTVAEIGARRARLVELRVGEPADLEAAELTLRYALPGLLRGRLAELDVDRLRLRGRIDTGGFSFGSGSGRLAGGGGAPAFPPVDRIRLRDARALLDTPAGPLEISGEAEARSDGALEAALALRAPRFAPLALRLRADPGRPEAGEAGLPISVEVDAAEGRAALAGQGRLRRDPPGADLTLQGTLSFEPEALQPRDLFPESSAWLARLSGTLEVRASARASEAGVELTLHLATEDADLETSGGLSFEDLTAEADLRGSELDVQGASWSYAGGRLRTAGRFDLAAEEHPFTVEVSGVSLERLLEQLAVAGLSGSGRLSGELPLVFDGESFRVARGSLAAEAPGVVRYVPAGAAAEGLGVGGDLEVLVGALEELHYEKLRLELDGALSGDVRLKAEIDGRNPRYEGGRPIELNLNLEANLPALLRGGRSLTRMPEVIERRLQGRVPGDGD
jgi:hypothetical protein